MREVIDLYPPGIYRLYTGELRLLGAFDRVSRNYLGHGFMNADGEYRRHPRITSTESLEDDQLTLVISVEDIMKTIKESENA